VEGNHGGDFLYAEYLNPIPSQINMESENLFNSAHNSAFQAHLNAVWMGGGLRENVSHDAFSERA
jgi:hypothetical protein